MEADTLNDTHLLYIKPAESDEFFAREVFFIVKMRAKRYELESRI